MAFINFPSLPSFPPSPPLHSTRLCQLSSSSSHIQTAHDEQCLRPFHDGKFCSIICPCPDNQISLGSKWERTSYTELSCPAALPTKPGLQSTTPFQPICRRRSPRHQQKWERKKCLKVLSKLSSQLCFTRRVSEWADKGVEFSFLSTYIYRVNPTWWNA